MNIVQLQNMPSQIEMLAAQRHLYSTAKNVIGLQIFLSGPAAIAATLFGIFDPSVKTYVAAWGLLVIFFDLVIFLPWQKKLKDSAARVQELFDCTVLSLSWNELKTGRKPERELIHEHYRNFGNDPKAIGFLKDWYPTIVQDVPIIWGAIICQRCNVWWDSKQRRRYAMAVAAGMLFVSLGLLAYGAYANVKVLDFIIYIAVPMASGYAMGYRQITEHREAADRLDKLKEHAEKLWEEALQDATVQTLKVKLRNLQDEIFDGRKRNPLIFDFIFKRFRSEHELAMNVGADALVSQARKKLSKPTH
jgi:hypothetical protein